MYRAASHQGLKCNPLPPICVLAIGLPRFVGQDAQPNGPSELKDILEGGR